MRKTPLISVIVPAYNAEQWVGEACRSVVEQTFTNWELIVVDDGSVDRTYEIVRQLAEEHSSIRLIHTENGGVCKARNRGLDEAKGEYMILLDADDRLDPRALEILYGAITEHQADMAIGWKTDMTPNGELRGCPYQRERRLLKNEESLEYSLRDHPSMYAAWGKLYKRGLIEDVRFIEGRRVHEDSFFVFRCCLKQPTVALLDDIVVQYRSTPNSASRAAFSEKFFDILYFAERKKEAVDEQYPQYADLADNMLIKAHMAMLRNLCRNKGRTYRKAERRCIREIIARKEKFIPALEADGRFFKVVTCRMYPVYKILYHLLKK